MQAPENRIETLAEIRKASGLTLAKIVEQAAEVDTEFPRTHVGLLEIEERGTRDYWKIKALAHVFNRPHDTMAVILKPKK